MNGGTIKRPVQEWDYKQQTSIYTPTGQLILPEQVPDNIPNGKGKMFWERMDWFMKAIW